MKRLEKIRVAYTKATQTDGQTREESPDDQKLLLLIAHSIEKNTAITKNIMLILMTVMALGVLCLISA